MTSHRHNDIITDGTHHTEGTDDIMTQGTQHCDVTERNDDVITARTNRSDITGKGPMTSQEKGGAMVTSHQWEG